MNLEKIQLPKRYNYIACFLTLDCNLKCAYCINLFGVSNKSKKRIISGKQWAEGLNRIICSNDLPVTLQGGEPSLHPDFFEVIKNIKKGLNIDILTNLCFDVDRFIKEVNPNRLSRSAPYPNIRVSYHPYYVDLGDLIKKALKMQQAGFSIGIFCIRHPKFKKQALSAQKQCLKFGIGFRIKEFLGEFNGRISGTYFYPAAIGSIKRKSCLCRTSELIIGPDGRVYRCHHDLYKDFVPVGNLLDPDFKIRDIFRKCKEFGDCNPCDVKIKTNRFQVHGHTSVEIKNINSGA